MRDLSSEAIDESRSGTAPLSVVIVQRQLEGSGSGNDTYLALVLESLRRAGFDVRLVFAPERSFGNRPWSRIDPRIRDLAGGIDWPRSLRMGDRLFSLSPRVHLRFAIRAAKEALRRLGFRGRLAEVRSLLGDPLPPHEERATLARLSGLDPKLVIAEYSSLAPLLARLDSRAIRAVLLHDLFSRRAETMRAAGLQPDFAAPGRTEEADRCATADLLLYASENERSDLAPMLPGRIHCWVRPSVPMHGAVPRRTKPRAVFLGTRHAGNADALRLLMEEIWPRVLAEIPDAELAIAGSIGLGLPATWARLPGCRILGRVERLEELGGQDAIGLAPTRVASGVSIKVAEYLALGMPTVALPAALEGFGAALDDLVVRVATPEEAARETVALLRDPVRREALSRRGRAAVAERLRNTEFEAVLRGIAGMASGGGHGAGVGR